MKKAELTQEEREKKDAEKEVEELEKILRRATDGCDQPAPEPKGRALSWIHLKAPGIKKEVKKIIADMFPTRPHHKKP